MKLAKLNYKMYDILTFLQERKKCKCAIFEEFFQHPIFHCQVKSAGNHNKNKCCIFIELQKITSVTLRIKKKNIITTFILHLHLKLIVHCQKPQINSRLFVVSRGIRDSWQDG